MPCTVILYQTDEFRVKQELSSDNFIIITFGTNILSSWLTKQQYELKEGRRQQTQCIADTGRTTMGVILSMLNSGIYSCQRGEVGSRELPGTRLHYRIFISTMHVEVCVLNMTWEPIGGKCILYNPYNNALVYH